MSASRGFVYIMINSSMPGLLKIGASVHHPLERAKQLSAPTSVAIPFVLAYYREVEMPFQVEAEIHRALTDRRTSDSREFFKMPLHEAVTILDRYEGIRPEPENSVSTPWAELFATFPDDGSGRELTDEEQLKCDILAAQIELGLV